MGAAVVAEPVVAAPEPEVVACPVPEAPEVEVQVEQEVQPEPEPMPEPVPVPVPVDNHWVANASVSEIVPAPQIQIVRKMCSETWSEKWNKMMEDCLALYNWGGYYRMGWTMAPMPHFFNVQSWINEKDL